MSTYLQHHGVEGQKWGVRNGPPYPLSENKRYAQYRKEYRRNKLKSKLSIDDRTYSDAAQARDFFTNNKNIQTGKKFAKKYHNFLVTSLFDGAEFEMTLNQQQKNAVKSLVRKWPTLSSTQKKEVMDMLPDNIASNWEQFVKDELPNVRQEDKVANNALTTDIAIMLTCRPLFGI